MNAAADAGERPPLPPDAPMAHGQQAAMPHRAADPGERLPDADEQPSEAHGHQHRDVSGGWLRPAVFGAMDGLVTNASLIAGVGGGGASAHTIVLTGLAGLAAGAGSMAAGERSEEH